MSLLGANQVVARLKMTVVVIDYCCMVNGGGSCTGVHLNGKKKKKKYNLYSAVREGTIRNLKPLCPKSLAQAYVLPLVMYIQYLQTSKQTSY